MMFSGLGANMAARSLQQQQQNRMGAQNPTTAPTADPLRNNSATLGQPYQYNGGTPLQDVAQGFNVQMPQMNQNNGVGLSMASNNTGMTTQPPPAGTGFMQQQMPQGHSPLAAMLQRWMATRGRHQQPQMPPMQKPQGGMGPNNPAPWSGMQTGHWTGPVHDYRPGAAPDAMMNQDGTPYVKPQPFDWNKISGNVDWSHLAAPHGGMKPQQLLSGLGMASLAQNMRL